MHRTFISCVAPLIFIAAWATAMPALGAEDSFAAREDTYPWFQATGDGIAAIGVAVHSRMYRADLSYQDVRDTPGLQGPEKPLALYFDAVANGKPNPAAFADLFKSDEPVEQIERMQKNGKLITTHAAAIHFIQRTDAGARAYITCLFAPKPGQSDALPLPGWIYIVERIGETWRLTTQMPIGPAEEDVIAQHGINLIHHKAGVTNHKYAHRIEIPLAMPAAPDRARNVTLLLDGVVHYKNLGAGQPDQNPVVRLAAQTVAAYRTGNVDAWFKLWADPDAAQWREFFSANEDAKTTRKDLQDHFGNDPIHLIYTIDFGTHAAFYLERKAESGPQVDVFLAWKDPAGTLKLTRGADLPTGDSTFPANPSKVLRSEHFKSEIFRFAKAVAQKKPL